MSSTANQDAATFAEQITSPAFAKVNNLAWRNSPNTSSDERAVTEDIMMGAIQRHPENVSVSFEMKRQAALGALALDNFGKSPFYTDYILELPGVTGRIGAEKTKADTGAAGTEVIHTNSGILNLQAETGDPIDFFGRSLQLIMDRKSSSHRNAIGPENYATSIKFFADKIVEAPQTLTEEQEQSAKKLLERWLEGYKNITTKDKPNFVEVTNIAAAVQRIPKNLLPEGLAPVFVRHALETLPQHSRRSILAILNATALIKTSETPLESAVLVDLSVNMLGQIQDSKELRSVFRALANQKPSQPTNEALSTVIRSSHGIVGAMTQFEGLLGITESLRKIINHATTDPKLSMLAKEVARECVMTAATRLKTLQANPSTDAEILKEDIDRARQIGIIYQAL